MKIFTIENETNNVTVHGTLQDAEAVANAKTFRSESGLHKLATDWPAARLGETWNSLPGVSPVKKFKDRQTAVARIWKALQGLGQAAQPTEPDIDSVQEESQTVEPVAAISEEPEPTPPTHVAPQTPDVTPAEAPSTKKATSRKNAQVAARNEQNRPGGRDAPAQGRRHAVRDHDVHGLAEATRCGGSWRAR